MLLGTGAAVDRVVSGADVVVVPVTGDFVVEESCEVVEGDSGALVVLKTAIN